MKRGYTFKGGWQNRSLGFIVPANCRRLQIKLPYNKETQGDAVINAKATYTLPK